MDELPVTNCAGCGTRLQGGAEAQGVSAASPGLGALDEDRPPDRSRHARSGKLWSRAEISAEELPREEARPLRGEDLCATSRQASSLPRSCQGPNLARRGGSTRPPSYTWAFASSRTTRGPDRFCPGNRARGSNCRRGAWGEPAVRLWPDRHGAATCVPVCNGTKTTKIARSLVRAHGECGWREPRRLPTRHEAWLASASTACIPRPRTTPSWSPECGTGAGSTGTQEGPRCRRPSRHYPLRIVD